MCQRRIIAFILAALSLISFDVLAEYPQKIPCDKYTESPLDHLAYGIETPKKKSGWQCIVLSSSDGGKAVIFMKGKKAFALGEDPKLGDVGEKDAELIFGDTSSADPTRSVRLWTEMFLGNKAFTEKSIGYKKTAEELQPKSKAVLFSKNNEQIVIYTNDGKSSDWGKEYSNQSASIYKKGNGARGLLVSCSNCTPDEFFSLIINPAIQR